MCLCQSFCGGCGICPDCNPEHDCQACAREHNSGQYEEGEPDPMQRMWQNAMERGVPAGTIQRVEAGCVFLYSGDYHNATAYLIADGIGSTDVQHQWDGCCCIQARFTNARLYALEGYWADELSRLMDGDARHNAAELEELIQWACPVAAVFVDGEALVSVSSEEYGRFYIATSNSD